MNNNAPQAGRGLQRNRPREKFWRRTLKAFAVSGQSVRAFCAARGVSEPSFYVWRRALAQRDAMLSENGTPASPAPAFVPVRLADYTTGRMEVILAGGRRIRLRGPVDRSALAEVVAALEGQPYVPSSAK